MKVILGGGLGGLSSAYYLTKQFPTQPTVIYEASNRVGGWIKSNQIEDNVIFEQTARTLRPKGDVGYNTLQLIHDLGIGDKVIPIKESHPAAKNRMIYANGKLHRLPSSLKEAFQRKPPFTRSLITYILYDLIAQQKIIAEKDESIYSFVNRRFGKEIAEYAISPLICGICAGNAQEISVKFLMKSFFEKEQKYGSVIKGVLYEMWKRKPSHLKFDSPLVDLAVKEKWNVYSLKGGLETLPTTLKQNLEKKGVDIMLNMDCERLEFDKECVLTVKGQTEKIYSDHIISSLSSPNLANLVQQQHPSLSYLLKEIPVVDVAVVNLLYDSKVHSYDAFGFLVPPSQNLPILGVIFDSCCFSMKDKTVLTVMMGGHWFKNLFGESPEQDELLYIALEQVKNIMGITMKPDTYKVQILRKCIPQYTVGHEQRIRNIEKYILDNKLPLSICGSSYYGVGVNDVIFSAKKVVDALED